MPELPEVETVKNTLKQLVLNKQIVDVEVYYDKIIKNTTKEEFIKDLKNQTIVDIKRKGKYLIFVLNDYLLVSHLRMEGKYNFMHDEARSKHEHIIFRFSDNSNLRYDDTRKFGTMDLFHTTNINDILTLDPLAKVGYDPFEEGLKVDDLFVRFRKITKPIKSTLLDQTIISGLGNIYVDEVLFLTKIHPLTPTNHLSKDDIEKLIENSRTILTKSIKLGGTTIKSFTSAHFVTGRFQNELLVHTKAVCPVCGEKIVKIKVGGRGTYLCEKCQKMIDKCK